MTLAELKSKFINSLSGLYPPEEIQSFFGILSEHFLKLTRIEIAINSHVRISEENLERFQNSINGLKKYEPIQYIIEETEFFGLRFKVNPHTLIPRPETEELVEWIISEHSALSSNLGDFKILDIGTGSGCIAIALTKNLPGSVVQALDFSTAALEVARENAILNKVAIEFFNTDILKTETLPTENTLQSEKYDVIVSNPPYVREMEKEKMSANVLSYEPSTALFVKDDDPLIFYKRIAHLAKIFLKPSGLLFFEINEYLGKELKTYLKQEGFKQIEIRQDIFGKDRMVKCTLDG